MDIIRVGKMKEHPSDEIINLYGYNSGLYFDALQLINGTVIITEDNIHFKTKCGRKFTLCTPNEGEG